MKKCVKKVLLVSLITAVVFNLCSCMFIDDLRQSHGIITDDTNEEIVINGIKYKPINSEKIKNIRFVNGKYITVSDDDYPLLINQIVPMYSGNMSCLGNYLYVSKDIGSVYENLFSEVIYKQNETAYYCRADNYDELVSRIKNEKCTNYCYCMISNEFEEKYVAVDKKVGNIINSIVSDKKMLVDSKKYKIKKSYIDVNRCDEKYEFMNFNFKHGSELEIGFNKYGVSLIYDYATDNMYKIPQKYTEIVKDWLKETRKKIRNYESDYFGF